MKMHKRDSFSEAMTQKQLDAYILLRYFDRYLWDYAVELTFDYSKVEVRRHSDDRVALYPVSEWFGAIPRGLIEDIQE